MVDERKPEPGKGRDYVLKTLENGLSVLKLFSPSESCLSLKTMDEKLHLGKSRTFKLVRTLVKAGFLRENFPERGYVLGPAVVALGLLALGQMDVRRLARPILAELAQATQETAILTMLNGESSVVIDKVDSPHSVRMAAELGSRGVLHAGGSSVPLLAFGPEVLRQKFLSGGVPLTRFTENTATTVQALDDLLRKVRANGYHVSKEEVERDIMAVGAPVLDRRRVATLCVSVAGPIHRMEVREEAIIKEVVGAANKLGSLLAV